MLFWYIPLKENREVTERKMREDQAGKMTWALQIASLTEHTDLNFLTRMHL